MAAIWVFAEQKFLGIDALGWEFIAVLVALFGFPFGKHFLRAFDIWRNWKVETAKICKTTIEGGVPPSVAPRWIAIWVAPPVSACYCRATYVYLVDGALYEGWFALMAGNVGDARKIAQELQDHPIFIKYNPRKPSDAVLNEKQVLDRQAWEDDMILNPKVW
jgi:hypothetical protein